MFKNKKSASQRPVADLHINEGLYKTKSGEVVRFTNIDAYFESFNNTEIKSVISCDMLREQLIKKCYEFDYTELTESKTIFECAMLTSINNSIGNTGVKCESFKIEKIDKVY